MFCQAFRFLAGKMNDCPMFGRSEVSSPHYSLVKLSQRSEMYEVGSFTESEIMNLLPVHIIHQHPSTSPMRFHKFGASHAVGSGSYQRALYS